MPKRTEKVVNPPVEKGAPEMTDQKSMVRATGAGLMTSAPDWLKAELDANKELRGAGFENVTGADLVLPRLAIVHGTSPELMQKDLELQLGDVFDTVTKQCIFRDGGKTTMLLLVASKSRIRFEKPQPPSPVLCRSLDGLKAQAKNGMTQREEPTDNCADCVHGQFADDKKPTCTEFLSYLAIFPEFNFMTYAISFKSTGLKKGRAILTQAKMTGAPMFAGRYELSTSKQTNGQNTWWVFDAKPAGWASEDEYKRAKELYQSFQGKTWAPTDLESEAGGEDTSFPPKDQSAAGAASEDTSGF